MYVVESIVRRYIQKNTSVETFFRERRLIYESGGTRSKVEYLRAKSFLQPHLMAAKRRISEKINKLEKANMLKYGFISVHADNKDTIAQLIRDLQGIEHYLHR